MHRLVLGAFLQEDVLRLQVRDEKVLMHLLALGAF